jgi:RHS repeat-associated protein
MSQSGGVNRTLTYDLNGSITSDGGTRTFEWDGANRLVAINYTGFTTRSGFTYDGLNRVAKIVEKTGATINSTRKFVWHGQEKLEFRDATDAVTQRNFAQGQYVGTTAYFYTRDHLGSIREMFTGGGTVVARYDYDPYGRSTTVLGTTPTDFNFTGLYRHSKSNLDLAVYRAYDPDLGRWLSRDPLRNAELLPEGPNLDSYIANNPTRWTDSAGLTYYNLSFQAGLIAGINFGWIFDHRGAHFYFTSGLVTTPGVSLTCAPDERAVATPGEINSVGAAAVVAVGAGSDVNGNDWTFEYGLGTKGVQITQGYQWDNWYPTRGK